jgi:hypothetical protein
MASKKVTFYADEGTLQTIERQRERTGACVSEILRRAVRKAYVAPAPIEKRTSPQQPVLFVRPLEGPNDAA